LANRKECYPVLGSRARFPRTTAVKGGGGKMKREEAGWATWDCGNIAEGASKKQKGPNPPYSKAEGRTFCNSPSSIFGPSSRKALCGPPSSEDAIGADIDLLPSLAKRYHPLWVQRPGQRHTGRLVSVVKVK